MEKPYHAVLVTPAQVVVVVLVVVILSMLNYI